MHHLAELVVAGRWGRRGCRCGHRGRVFRLRRLLGCGLRGNVLGRRRRTDNEGSKQGGQCLHVGLQIKRRHRARRPCVRAPMKRYFPVWPTLRSNADELVPATAVGVQDIDAERIDSRPYATSGKFDPTADAQPGTGSDRVNLRGSEGLDKLTIGQTCQKTIGLISATLPLRHTRKLLRTRLGPARPAYRCDPKRAIDTQCGHVGTLAQCHSRRSADG